jgi:2,4-dienoyl-CoA reductase-like NADH-dependent reductase (Old Yellow Enzyme family)
VNTTISTPLTLPCGVTLPNRIAKAAMSEQLADRHGRPTDTLVQLYSAWGRGGAGLLLTGNVMVDPTAYVEPRNAVLAENRAHRDFSRWATAAKQCGAVAVMQINHPGRVATAPLGRRPVGPSALRPGAVGFNLRKPRALTVDQIAGIRQAFARTAQLAVEAGFDGVQVHAAHGYLLSQFLSPVANQRTDDYGGSAENRRRLLLEIVADVRAAIGPDKVLAVKLNSADFEAGGLDHEESLAAAVALADAGIDLLEVSGGNYEAPAMTGIVSADTRRREAYFLEYAEALRVRCDVPLMLTGGVRSRGFIDEVLAAGSVDILGLGRPFAVQPDTGRQLLAGGNASAATAPHINLRAATPANAWLELAWHARNFRAIAGGATDLTGPGALRTLASAGTKVTVNALTQR